MFSLAMKICLDMSGFQFILFIYLFIYLFIFAFAFAFAVQVVPPSDQP